MARGIAYGLRGTAHDIVLGSRDAAKAEALAAEMGEEQARRYRGATLEAAVARADVCFLAVPWEAALETAAALREALAGRVLVDLTNPLAPTWDRLIVADGTSAAEELARHGVWCDVICLTSADLVFRACQARQGLLTASSWILDELFPASRQAPIVSVLDGHPHTLSFLGSIHGNRQTHLGVHDFGQVGDIEDLYRHYGIDTETIVGAAYDLLDNRSSRQS